MRPYLLLLFLCLFNLNAQSQNGPTAVRRSEAPATVKPCSVHGQVSAMLVRARSGNDLVYWPALYLVAKRMEYVGRQFMNSRADNNLLAQPEMLLTGNSIDGSCRVKIDNAPPGEYQLRILNSKEEVVYLEVVQMKEEPFQKTLRLSYLPTGTYPVVLLNKQGVVEKRKKLVVAR